MIEVSHETPADNRCRILARANFSLSLSHLLKVILALSLGTVALAAFLALQGYWPILPIALLQSVLVSLALFRAWRETWAQDLIEVDDQVISVTRRTAVDTFTCKLQTGWARVELRRDSIDWYPPRLMLHSAGQRVELGRFLNRKERIDLAGHLRQALSHRTVWSE